MPITLLSIFGSAGLLYGLLLPLITIVLFTLIAIPSFLSSSKNIDGVSKAVYCYLSQLVGILLMTLGALPTVFAVLAGTPLSTPTYLSLLATFSAGGLTFLWHDALVQTVASSARAVH